MDADSDRQGQNVRKIYLFIYFDIYSLYTAYKYGLLLTTVMYIGTGLGLTRR
jgi:hypothetical protein